MRAHNRKIRFSPWRYLNLLDLYSLETLAEWTGKAAVLVSLCGQVAHATLPLIRGFGRSWWRLYLVFACLRQYLIPLAVL
jgi:hypothetical protein